MPSHDGATFRIPSTRLRNGTPLVNHLARLARIAFSTGLFGAAVLVVISGTRADSLTARASSARLLEPVGARALAPAERVRLARSFELLGRGSVDVRGARALDREIVAALGGTAAVARRAAAYRAATHEPEYEFVFVRTDATGRTTGTDVAPGAYLASVVLERDGDDVAAPLVVPAELDACAYWDAARGRDGRSGPLLAEDGGCDYVRERMADRIARLTPNPSAVDDFDAARARRFVYPDGY